jgi:hypothetical protein
MNGVPFLIAKQPGEKIPCTLDLADYLPAGETIQNASTVVITDATGADMSAVMLHATSINSPKITAVLKAGTSGAFYTVTFFIVTETYQFEEEVRLAVRARTAA